MADLAALAAKLDQWKALYPEIERVGQE
jgi:hypothetical protein